MRLNRTLCRWLCRQNEAAGVPAPATGTDEVCRGAVAATKPRIRLRADGWIRHDGSPFPFDPSTPVEIAMTGGAILRGKDTEYASYWPDQFWRWEATSWRHNIAFYRISGFDLAGWRRL